MGTPNTIFPQMLPGELPIAYICVGCGQGGYCEKVDISKKCIKCDSDEWVRMAQPELDIVRETNEELLLKINRLRNKLKKLRQAAPVFYKSIVGDVDG